MQAAAAAAAAAAANRSGWADWQLEKAARTGNPDRTGNLQWACSLNERCRDRAGRHANVGRRTPPAEDRKILRVRARIRNRAIGERDAKERKKEGIGSLEKSLMGFGVSLFPSSFSQPRAISRRASSASASA